MVLGKIKSLFQQPSPAGSPETVRKFGSSDEPLTRDGVSADQGGWRIDIADERSVRLFEIPDPGIEQCVVTYRAQIKTADAEGRVYLEMWCRFPGRGEFFSKGFQQAVKGTTDWAGHETPFNLKKGQRPDLIKLNVVSESRATVWLKDIELLKTDVK